MNIVEYVQLPFDTKNIIEDLIHVISLMDDDYCFEENGYKFSNIRFFVQEGCELYHLWYVRKDAVVYENGEKGLWVSFRPNLKSKPYKPDFLRTSYSNIGGGKL